KFCPTTLINPHTTRVIPPRAPFHTLCVRELPFQSDVATCISRTVIILSAFARAAEGSGRTSRFIIVIPLVVISWTPPRLVIIPTSTNNKSGATAVIHPNAPVIIAPGPPGHTCRIRELLVKTDITVCLRATVTVTSLLTRAVNRLCRLYWRSKHPQSTYPTQK